MELTREVLNALSAAFPDDELEFLPRAHANGKALALAYIDARAVMRRLDAVVGPENWSFDFDVLSPDGKMVKGRLTVCGVTKCDAGEGSTEDELLKSAVSDALKRCAVHFGIGRYLYHLPKVWAPYDNQRRTWVEPPRINPAAVQKALAICGVSPAAAASAPRTATRTAPAPEFRGRGGQPLNVHSAAELICRTGTCEAPLTKGQHDMAMRAYGEPLCPACQKQRAAAQAVPQAAAAPGGGRARPRLTAADCRN